MFDVKEDIAIHYKEYWNFLQNYLRKKFAGSLDDEEVEDISSHIFLTALQKHDKFTWEGEGSFQAWLCILARNRALNYLGSSAVNKTSSQENENISWEINEKYSDTQDENRFLYNKLLEYLEKNESSINRKIMLGFANGFSYEELSEIFELPMGTLKSRIHLVRTRILEHFKNIEL
jgi:RNA polymerase sigma-70 factor (ECF subfamily)